MFLQISYILIIWIKSVSMTLSLNMRLVEEKQLTYPSAEKTIVVPILFVALVPLPQLQPKKNKFTI